MSAKPIIDIDVVIEDYIRLENVISALDKIGYRHEGDLGIAEREAFKYDGKEYLCKHHFSDSILFTQISKYVIYMQ